MSKVQNMWLMLAVAAFMAGLLCGIGVGWTASGRDLQQRLLTEYNRGADDHTTSVKCSTSTGTTISFTTETTDAPKLTGISGTTPADLRVYCAAGDVSWSVAWNPSTPMQYLCRTVDMPKVLAITPKALR